jgi:multicomponent K+:H+ antiporter subunit D
MGINGAFLTGDLFNLFVFFEVMLIASYGLLLHGGGPRRLGAGLHYVAINLVGSTLFLFAVGILYAVTGTLNLADLAVKVGQVESGNTALLRTGALLLFLVFALKAALVPLHWWLPTAYAAAPAPAAALFAIMTKVGAYSIIRVYTLVFGAEGGAAALIAAPWLLPAALATLVVGALGVLASRALLDLVCFAIVWSMGSLLVALALFDAKGLTAALYYTLHSTLIGAALFLLADLIASARGRLRDRLQVAPPPVRAALLGGLFFLAAIAMAGLPPLSGFLGKLMILDATRTAASFAWTWTIVLATSLVVIIGFARAGSTLFWKAETMLAAGPAPVAGRVAPLVAAGALIGGTALLSLFAGPITRQLDATAHQLLDTRGYIEACLGRAAPRRPPVREALTDAVAAAPLPASDPQRRHHDRLDAARQRRVRGPSRARRDPGLVDPTGDERLLARSAAHPAAEGRGGLSGDGHEGHRGLERPGRLPDPVPARQYAPVPVHHRAARPHDRGGDHHTRRDHHADARNGQRGPVGRRPGSFGALPRDARPSRDRRADQGALRAPAEGDLRVMIDLACVIALLAVAAATVLTLYRLAVGPDVLDRILALDTLVINAIALIVVVGLWYRSTMYFEAALLFAMVGFLSTVAFCKYLLRGT